jgi:Carboxypeptidase regulatory-like domain
MTFRTGVLTLVLLWAAGMASAQERFGALTGRVTDQQGGAIPGVIIVTTHMETGEIRSFVTDASGQYVAPDLTPGRYTVRFELIGFAKVERSDVLVEPGRTLEVNSQLNVSQLSEILQVEGIAPHVDTRSTLVTHNVTAEEFERIPKGRSFQSIAVTAPSVNQGDIEGGLQVNGASGSENQFTVDGVATNSLLNGQSRQNTVFEYLQEVQVKTVGIPAEFGGALGGVISAVTKSGSNTFRGEAHYYYLGSELSAGPVKRLVLSPVDEQTVSYVQDPKPADHRHEIGGSLGGPIVRGQLFFFGSMSPRFRHRIHDYKFDNGLEPGRLENTQAIVNAYGKVSYSHSRFNTSVAALWTPTYSDGTLTGYNGLGPQFQSSTLASNEPNRTRGFTVDQRNVTVNADINLTTSTLLRVKGGYFRDDYRDEGSSETTSVRYRSSSIGLNGVPPELQGGTGFQNTPAVEIVNRDTTTQLYVQADYSAVFTAGGLHTLKAGAGVRRNGNVVDQRYPGGQVNVFWDSTFTSSVPGVGSARGAFGYYEVNDFGTAGQASANIAHVYVQDQWTVGNLTLNVGVRLESETIPSFRPEIRAHAIRFGFGDKIAPRVGAAYDLFGNGRAKVFGSYGRYYDWTKYELSRLSFGGDIWKVYYRSLDDPTHVLTLNLSHMPGRDLWGSPEGYRDRRVPNFDSVDPAIKPMSQDSYSVGAEYQLGGTSVVTLNYVHNDLVRTIEDIGLLVNGNEVYLYANPGEGAAKDALISTATSAFTVPKAKRQYDALQVSMVRGFSRNWFMGGSYVWSRLYGNYSGLQNSDEIRTPTLGLGYTADQQQAGSVFRLGGNANRSWDLDESMWDGHGHLNPQGRLATDRPHVMKLYGATVLPFGTEIGVNFYAGSGTPLSTYVNTLNGIEVLVNGRGDMGRTPVLSTTDLLLSHQIRMRGRQRMRLELNVLNVFNQKTVRHRFNYLNRARASAEIDLSGTNLAQGYDYNAMIDAKTDPAGPRDPRYGMEDLFSEGRSGHLLVRWLF